MRTTYITSLGLTVALVSALAGGTAAASASDTPSSRVVRVSDLNLSTPEGADVALQRIRRAAQYVCGDGSNAHILWTSRSYRSCVQQASGRAIADLGNPMVTARGNGSKPVQIAGK